MSDVFLTATAGVLPGPPIGNDAIEDVLGRIGDKPSPLRARILRNNGIRARHYAIDLATGAPTHTAASLCAEAVRAACAEAAMDTTAIELLACGTSLPEQVTPGLASLVHGELGGSAMEIATTHGVCCAGLTALKYASLAVRAGGTRRAVAAAVERCSTFLRAEHFGPELLARAVDEDGPYVGLDAEFLRWMLSDGAGAVVLSDTPREGAANLRVEWVELTSFAHEMPTCMYMGAERTPEGGLRGWRDVGIEESVRKGNFNLRQDVKLLERIVPVCAKSLAELRRKRDLTPDDVDWFLPHYSSELFRPRTHDSLVAEGFPIPYDRWASNLVERGNTGSASIYVMLDDLVRSGRVRPGQGVLLMVPESGRFSCGWALLRAT